MAALLCVVTVLCISYFAAVSILFKVPESLSATYYSLGKYGWVFQAVLFSVGVLMLPVWMSVSEESHYCLCFLTCSALLFVAAAPAFRMKLEGKVHYSSAAVCCVCSVLWQILEGVWDVTLFFGFFCGMLAIQWREKWCWWLEVAVVGSLLANLWRVL